MLARARPGKAGDLPQRFTNVRARDYARILLTNLPRSLDVVLHQGRHRSIIPAMATLLWIIAAVLVIFGIFRIVRGDILWGIVLIVVGLLVGPGGVSIFNV